VLSSIRRRVTFANSVAVLALVFAMSGGAIAATHYLITSKSQISPKVLKALKGKTGRQGARGPAGAPGAAGSPGATGAAGAAGSALAYADVVLNGIGNPSIVVGSGFTGVSEPSAGVFCLAPLLPGHPAIVSDGGGDNEAIFAEVADEQCPGDYEIAVTNGFSLSGGQGFNITVP
jgi:hypothetical protein